MRGVPKNVVVLVVVVVGGGVLFDGEHPRIDKALLTVATGNNATFDPDISTPLERIITQSDTFVRLASRRNRNETLTIRVKLIGRLGVASGGVRVQVRVGAMPRERGVGLWLAGGLTIANERCMVFLQRCARLTRLPLHSNVGCHLLSFPAAQATLKDHREAGVLAAATSDRQGIAVLKDVKLRAKPGDYLVLISAPDARNIAPATVSGCGWRGPDGCVGGWLQGSAVSCEQQST